MKVGEVLSHKKIEEGVKSGIKTLTHKVLLIMANANHPSTGTLGDFTVSPEFHTHNHTVLGAIDMAALTELATAEKVNTDVLQLVLSHQVSMTKMINEAAGASGALQMKADAARREHELAICDRVMGGLPVVMAAARELMSSPADTAEISALKKAQKAQAENTAELRIDLAQLSDLTESIIESLRKELNLVSIGHHLENGKGKGKGTRA